MKVVIVAEYYPRAGDAPRGVWAHRQTIAARDAGAEVRVLVLHRPVPPLQSLRRLDLRRALAEPRQPRSVTLDGVEVEYLRYISPPRAWSYSAWGAWAAPVLGRRLRALRRAFPFDAIHAHYAVPAGDAVRRAAPDAPLLVSVHGHDVYGPGSSSKEVRATLGTARLVLVNSAGTGRRSVERGARTTRVVHLGTDPVDSIRALAGIPTLVSVARLIDRKRITDVIEAVAKLAPRHPELRYLVVGDGPARQRIAALAASAGVADRVQLRGSLPHDQAVAIARSASIFVLPSVDEAFGVAYVEAMAAGVPAIGCRGEDGPEEIAAAGGGIALVPPRDPTALAAQIDELLTNPGLLQRIGRDAFENVRREFTWEKCGRETVQAYREVVSGPI